MKHFEMWLEEWRQKNIAVGQPASVVGTLRLSPHVRQSREDPGMPLITNFRVFLSAVALAMVIASAAHGMTMSEPITSVPIIFVLEGNVIGNGSETHAAVRVAHDWFVDGNLVI